MSDILLRFPRESETHRYNLIHFRFFVQYAKIAGIDVELVDSDDRVFVAGDHLVFSCTVNDQQIIVDYADHSTKNWRHHYPGIPYFKFQITAKNSTESVPLGPPMVGVKRHGTKGATMREYNQVRYHYNYQPGSAILCKQLPNGAAIERRNLVHQLLIDNFDDVDITADLDQLDFWRAHERCLVAVCVPGATNNMVDRGHIELMGLGVCTVSPELYTVFPRSKSLTPGRHYIQCRDDYSDLVDIIRSLQRDPSMSLYVGKRARRFYEKYYTPQKYWEWIMMNLP